MVPVRWALPLGALWLGLSLSGASAQARCPLPPPGSVPASFSPPPCPDDAKQGEPGLAYTGPVSLLELAGVAALGGAAFARRAARR